jgi:hypothetical protein
MKKISLILVILILAFNSVTGQTDIDEIIMISGDTIHCKITLVNDQNIFYSYRNKKSEKYNHVMLGSVREYNWYSKNINNNQQTSKSLNSYSTSEKINLGIKLSYHFNYPITHTSPSLCLYKGNHSIFLGPEYTRLLKESLGDPVDSYEQEYWGMNIGYRYVFNSTWKKTFLFLQTDFSIYQLNYTEASQASPNGTEKKDLIIENTVGLGLIYKINNHFELIGGIGFGSMNYFFLMFDQFIPNSFIGLEYKF